MESDKHAKQLINMLQGSGLTGRRPPLTHCLTLIWSNSSLGPFIKLNFEV